MAERRRKSNKKFMLLSAIGIFMVVDSHTWITFDLFGGYIPYNSFFMPMFVFISGYFNRVDASTDLWAYTKKKLRTLLVPYLGLSLLAFGLQWLINWFKLGELPSIPSGYPAYTLDKMITVGSSVSIAEPMWFVMSLFAVLMVYALIKKLLYRFWNSFVMLAVFCCFHLLAVYIGKNMQGIFSPYLLIPLKCLFFLPFIELGIIYRDHLEKKHSGLSGGSKIALLFLLLLFNMIRTMYLPAAYDVAFNDLSELSGFTSPYIVTPMISSAVGILFWLTIAELFGKPVYESRLVNYMSCNTFWIMGLHIAFFNILNCMLALINGHIAELPYFDAEAFRETEFYFWELSPNFRLAYLVVGITGPLALKYIFDMIFSPAGKTVRK